MFNSCTLCTHCSRAVPVSCGFCVLCGNAFTDQTLAKSVTVTENDRPKYVKIGPKCVSCGSTLDSGEQAFRRYKLMQEVRLQMGWSTAA